jgi:hypothetical protein
LASQSVEELRERLREIFQRETPPDAARFMETIKAARHVLNEESVSARPPDANGNAGGLVTLSRGIPTLIMPDLHARMDFFIRVLDYEIEDGGKAIDLLWDGRAQAVCVGDGVHSEARALVRWREAFKEFREGYRRHRNMDEEMRESLGVMEMVMEAVRCFPDNFHFLKGNHENIANELGGGNFPFRKFALEGLMVLEYMRKFYGEELLREYALFEKDLPLLAMGRGFLVSHAEPAAFFSREDVIEYRSRPEVVSGLTWTDNGQAEKDSVRRMLLHFLGEEEGRNGLYFGGHRPVSGGFALRAEGRYVQIHDPDRFVIAHLPAEGDMDLYRDIRPLDGRPLMTGTEI